MESGQTDSVVAIILGSQTEFGTVSDIDSWLNAPEQSIASFLHPSKAQLRRQLSCETLDKALQKFSQEKDVHADTLMAKFVKALSPHIRELPEEVGNGMQYLSDCLISDL